MDDITISVNLDAIKIRDYPLIVRAARGETEPDALIEILERASPGAGDLPIRYMRIIMQRLAEALQDEQKN